MKTQELLHELVGLSPIIDNRISELSSSVMQAEYDSVVSGDKLLGEALSLLIELLAEQGLIFHVDDELLLADRYSIDFIINLYRKFIPNNISEYLNSVPLLRTNISASVMGVADDEFIVLLLESVRDTCRSEYNDDMYSFLHDKVISTNKYSSNINSILNELDDMSDTVHVDITSVDINFLIQLSKEKDWYKTCVTNLIYKSIVHLDYHYSLIITNQICRAYSRPENVILLSKYYDLVVSNTELITKVLNKIHSESDFYLEHYTDEQLGKLSLELIVAIILVQFIDKRLFGIEPNFKRLIDNVTNVPVADIIRSIPIQNTVN